MAKKQIRAKVPVEQQREYLRQIDQYREEHGTRSIDDAAAALGIDMDAKSYHNWRKRMHRDMSAGNLPVAIPLDAIPEKRARAPRKARVINLNRHQDDDKQIAAQLLEVAARLLRR